MVQPVHLFQSPDGDFVYSDEGQCSCPLEGGMSFNPLTGISSILTVAFRSDDQLLEACFNPLTGISSILTGVSESLDGVARP